MKNRRTETRMVIRPLLKEKFEEAYDRCQTVLFSAPCGCGKTVTARELLKGRKTVFRDAADPESLRKKIPAGCEALLLDNLQCLKDSSDKDALCTLIASHRDLHVILCGRCRLPGYLMPFKVAGNLAVLEMEDLLFDRETSLALLKLRGISADTRTMNRIQKDMKGYPLATEMLCRHLEKEGTYGGHVYTACERDVLIYLDEEVYRRLEQPVRSLLLDVAAFDEFTLELAKMASGNPHAGEIFGTLVNDSSMMRFGKNGRYSFHPVFRRMLLWESERERTDAERRELLSRAALYYELQGDLEKSLRLYSEAGEQGKVSSLLIKNAELHPGIGHYREMQEYYFALPENEILRSPSLMCGMSMLTSMRADYEASEKWYAALKKYAAGLNKKDPVYKDAMGKLSYLDIALPQRGTKSLIDVISKVFRIMTNQNQKMAAFSVTSMLPSIMNGGKDFSEWSKKDTLLYATMRRPVETVLGRDGIGLADCAICESYFEKGRDVNGQMLNLMARLGEIQSRGTPDIEFAVIGLLTRIQVSQNKAQQAFQSVQSLRERFEKTGETRFFGNIDAVLARIHMYLGDSEDVHEWLTDRAPKNELYLWPMWRYQYLTQAMAEIGEGHIEEAMLLLSGLIAYCRTAGRVIDMLYIKILMAVCRFRTEDKAWQADFISALDISEEYGFIRPIAQHGTAVLPLLKACGWEKNQIFLKKIKDAAKTQAVYYPKFLKVQAAPTEQLSQAEMQVLHLLSQNLTNAEIGEILDIRLATVKTHTRNIFQKLGVKNRTEAKERAQELSLL